MLGFRAPLGSRQRALFYVQLATLVEAGLPLFSTLDHIVRNPPHPGISTVSRQLLAELKQGSTFTEAFRSLPDWAPEFDLALIESGERSGRLEQAFRILARHSEAVAANWQAVAQEAAYPLLILHVAVFIVPLPVFVQSGNALQYLTQSVGALAFLYFLSGIVYWSTRPQRPPAWRNLTERVLIRLPILGTALSDLALSRLAASLEALISSGILITEAWPMAARASGSMILDRTVRSWKLPLDSGTTPAELVAASGVFPDLFVSVYSTGEASGRLEEQLRHLARIHEEQGFRKLRLFSQWSPRIFYGLVSIWIAFQILALAGGYMSNLQQLLGD